MKTRILGMVLGFVFGFLDLGCLSWMQCNLLSLCISFCKITN